MKAQGDLKKVYDKIQALKRTAEELNRMGADFPALARNTTRILASIKMLELNVSDVIELDS
jgi:aspartate/glutamate racemase